MVDNIFNQENLREWAENTLDASVMIPVYEIRNEGNFLLRSYIIPTQMIGEELKSASINNSFDYLQPRFIKYNYEGKEITEYQRWGNANGIEPIVICRNSDNFLPETLDIVEEFKLLFNLRYDSARSSYIDFNDGNTIIVIELHNNNLVNVHKKYLKRYLAIKEKTLIIHIINKYINKDNSIKINNGNEFHSNSEGTFCWELRKHYVNDRSCGGNYSFFSAKKVIIGCKLEDCDIWPFETIKNYEEFIIGLDENGNEIKHTCNPDLLGNNFGANKNSPNFLTPIFFTRDVLEKYYSKPELYHVDDGIINCNSSWSLRLDNDRADYVVVYLGDLGNDLPYSEQSYWKSFNIASDKKLSNTKIKRDFYAEFANAKSPDLVFKETYIRINKTFEDYMGWPLYLKLTEKDQYNFNTLHIPVNASIVEMDMLVLSLVKVLVDSLNEALIIKQLQNKYKNLNGSISKLEKLFIELNIRGYNEQIEFLRNLQSLRSCGTGHRKGDNYAKITAKLGFNDNNYNKHFAELLSKGTEFLLFIEKNLRDLCYNKNFNNTVIKCKRNE